MNTKNIKQAIMIMVLSAFGMSAMAQDPYLNNTIVNTSDLFGTSRFVAMGGAMGALGADISTISSNPAGLGLFTKNEMSLTAGASWLGNHTASGIADGTFGNFDQIGIVMSFKGSGKLRNVNLGFNYQKKIDYNNSFYGQTHTAASWADQLWGLASEASIYRDDLYKYGIEGYYNTLYSLAELVGIFENFVPRDKNGNENTDGQILCDNIVKTPDDLNSTVSVAEGSLASYDFNLSMNVDNRYFFGMTIGLDNVNYRRFTDYLEERTDILDKIQDFGYINEQHISGNGVNLKFGTIIRPFESSPFRFGLTVETPTWYSLKYVDDQSLITKYDWDDKKGKYVYDNEKYHEHYVYDLSDSYINYLEHKITTPWKVRAQMGSTVSTNFGWGVEYEFANYPGTTMKFPGIYGGTTKDEYFIEATERALRPQHTVRAGVEFKPISSLSLRGGYNFISSTTAPNSDWDPFMSDVTLSYPTGLDYMNLSDTHIATFGIGYRNKWFFADLAYKYRHQTGNYYAFNSLYSNVAMDPIIVDMSKHSINATIGVRF